MPRPCKCRRVLELPDVSYFKPVGIPLVQLEECVLSVEGFEALRLADWEGLGMDDAARHMGVSRHTFGRILRKARHAVAESLVLGRALRVEGGVYSLEGKAENAVPMLRRSDAQAVRSGDAGLDMWPAGCDEHAEL